MDNTQTTPDNVYIPLTPLSSVPVPCPTCGRCPTCGNIRVLIQPTFTWGPTNLPPVRFGTYNESCC